MSTEYYLACSTCRESYLIGQDGWKFFTFYSGETACMDGIGNFLEKHVLCGDGNKLNVLSEYKVDDFKEIEWPNAESKH